MTPPNKTITVTRSDLVELYRKWETDRRLRPGSFSSEFDNRERDVDELAEQWADELLERFAALAKSPGHVLRDLLHATTPPPIIPPFEPKSFIGIDFAGPAVTKPSAESVTAESCAAKAAEAIEASKFDSAAAWTDLARALS